MRIRHLLEYKLAQCGMALIPRLPRSVVAFLAHTFGFLAYLLSAHLRNTGRVNLDIAFGETKNTDEKRRILIRSFQTFALVLLDLFWFAHRQKERIDTYVHFHPGHDELFKEHPEATICVTAHAGNWELLGKSVALRYGQFTSIAAPLENEKLDLLFDRIRSETGQTIVKKSGAVRAMLKTLRSGGFVAFLLDQNTKPSMGGIFLDFFGLPVPVSTIGATLVMHTGARLVFGACLPDASGHYHVTPPLPIPTDTLLESTKPEQMQLLTGRILHVILRLA
ncbi:MAG: hypothetical protein PHP44_03490 [Kiritimatiellae bacterium]|nr:hypothetical protein [Kiritimatiellia bacterium]